MMSAKFVVVILFLLGSLMGSSSSAVASQNSGQKLARGLTNVMSFPLEIPKQTRAYWIQGAYYTDHIIIWAVSGALIGMIEGVKRGGSGIWDIITFPIEKPAGYKSLLTPDYVWEEWPNDPHVFIFLDKEGVDAK